MWCISHFEGCFCPNVDDHSSSLSKSHISIIVGSSTKDSITSKILVLKVFLIRVVMRRVPLSVATVVHMCVAEKASD
jgi:hypothetical protein